MFGTVARMRVKPGKLEELKMLMAQDEPRDVDGYLYSVAYRSSSDPQEVWMAAVFRDRESYVANAEAPSQSEMYARMRALLESDPEWHDGDVLFATPTAAGAVN